MGDGTGEDIGEHVDEHAAEDGDEDLVEDLDGDFDEELGEDRGEGAVDEDRLSICFGHSSRRCRWSWFLDEKTFSQCLQDGLLHMFSCACRIRRAIEENEALQSLQWW